MLLDFGGIAPSCRHTETTADQAITGIGASRKIRYKPYTCAIQSAPLTGVKWLAVSASSLLQA
jgi:hypothetical protein